MRGISIILSGFLLAACSSSPSSSPKPDISIADQPILQLALQELTAVNGESFELSIRVRNNGEGPLTYTSSTEGEAFRVDSTPRGIFGRGGDLFLLRVSCSAPFGIKQGTLRINSNDPDTPELGLELRLECLGPVQTEELLRRTNHTTAVKALNFSPDGARLLSGSSGSSDNRLIILNVSSGQVQNLVASSLSGVVAARWINNGSEVAALLSASGQDITLRTYNAQTAVEQISVQLRDSISGRPNYAWSPDGRRLVMRMSFDTTSVFNTLTGTRLFNLEMPVAPSDFNFFYAWKSDGSEIAGESSEIWSGLTGKQVRPALPLGIPGCSYAFQWNQDGTEFACDTTIFDSSTGRGKSGFRSTVAETEIAWSPSERTFLLSENTILRITNRSGGTLWQFANPNNVRFTAVAFSPDGRYFAAGDEQGGLHIWKLIL